MQKKVALLLAQGFEEAEAIVVVDILRRLKIQVDILSCQPESYLVGYWGIQVHTDALLSERQHESYDAIVLPGGPQGARSLGSSAAVIDFIKRHQEENRWICSICSAGAHVLSANNLLNGKRYVCSGDNHKLYTDGLYTDQRIIEDGNVITAKGLGVAFEFALYIGEKFSNSDTIKELSDHIYI